MRSLFASLALSAKRLQTDLVLSEFVLTLRLPGVQTVHRLTGSSYRGPSVGSAESEPVPADRRPWLVLRSFLPAAESSYLSLSKDLEIFCWFTSPSYSEEVKGFVYLVMFSLIHRKQAERRSPTFNTHQHLSRLTPSVCCSIMDERRSVKMKL